MEFQVTRRKLYAFTLIELLVVIAIIALLISILLPALSQARKLGQATKCGTNLHSVGQAMAAYLTENAGVFPPSYVYPDQNGDWGMNTQPASNPYGYIHWSYFLFSKGQAPEESFQCPTIPNGGHPRTNPGSTGWEEGQSDQNGQSGPNPLQDRQAIRMAYTGNAAIFPRNKFTTALSGGERVNVLVNESAIHDQGRTVLATEFNKNWRSTGIDSGGGVLVKSHRPVNPFWHIGSGSNEYAAGYDTPGFTYGDGPNYGLEPLGAVTNATALIDNPGISEVNSVGRHHPGGDPYSGGTVNFLYADMHVEKKSVLQTLQKHEWGNRYYAIDGANKVGPPW
ncbi:MAG TPA: prepilin-type N-terminal cleavage/methylation domain-containing protein [Phycisphaerae bacterium]|nr:prepilin-type N-terminal cleavage/methylation domain-containing protein [Phycisphaerae bacterium]